MADVSGYFVRNKMDEIVSMLLDPLGTVYSWMNPATILSNSVKEEYLKKLEERVSFEAQSPWAYFQYTSVASETTGGFDIPFVSRMDVARPRGDENCRYCGQLHKRESMYGGCPNCGAPHNAN